MRVILATLVVSTCNALPGSHFQVTIGGTSYSHGTKDDQPFKVELPALAPVSQNDIQTYASSSLVNATTSPPTHAPLFYRSPAASDKVHLTEAPPGVAQVYESHGSVYHSGIKYVTIPKNKTSPTLLKYHKSPKSNAEPQKQRKTQGKVVLQDNTTAEHTTSFGYKYLEVPSYNTNSHDCPSGNDVVTTKVCIPEFETKCTTVELVTNILVDKEICQDITNTVCSAGDKVIEKNLCQSNYEKKTEDAHVRTAKVIYTKECSNLRRTVCKPVQGYQSHQQQYCKEDDQKSCYNVPSFTGIYEEISVAQPSPIETCSNKTITIPEITCEDIVENRCLTVPEVVEKTQKIERCEVVLGEPGCQEVPLCRRRVYG